MAKERRTISIDPENEQYLSRPGVNASELINKLVSDYRAAGANEDLMLQLRAQQLESQINNLQSQLDTARQELDAVESSRSAIQPDVDAILAEAAEVIDADKRTVENPAVRNWAEKAQLDAETFLERLEDTA